MCSCHCSFTVVDGILCVISLVVLIEANAVCLLRSVLYKQVVQRLLLYRQTPIACLPYSGCVENEIVNLVSFFWAENGNKLKF